jgi:hypothetical protein
MKTGTKKVTSFRYSAERAALSGENSTLRNFQKILTPQSTLNDLCEARGNGVKFSLFHHGTK